MYHTLSDLKDKVNQLIEQQGENATCASFIYTKEDVYYFEDILDDEQYLSQDDTNNVLNEVGGSDYIYEQIGELIDDEVMKVTNWTNT